MLNVTLPKHDRQVVHNPDTHEVELVASKKANREHAKKLLRLWIGDAFWVVEERVRVSFGVPKGLSHICGAVAQTLTTFGGWPVLFGMAAKDCVDMARYAKMVETQGLSDE